MSAKPGIKGEVVPIVLCCAALLICLWIANPFVNSAFNDDWSYSHVALRLAETGRFHYNGWGSPTIVFQSIWGALFIRLFGFSFNILRVATLFFSLGFVVVHYVLCRRLGLRRNFSLFCAICVAVSPLFVPLAASFMTEPYSCFFSLLCVYAAVSSAESNDSKSAIIWLQVLALSGIFGGSSRQTVWAVPLALIPYLCWLRRHERHFLVLAAGAYSVCIIALVFIVANFSQKYGPLEMSKRELLKLAFANGLPALHMLGSVFLACLLMALPAFLCFLQYWNRMPGWHLFGLFLLSLLLFDYFRSGFGIDWGTVPFAGNLLTVRGLLNRWVDGLGYRPVILHHSLTFPLTYLLLLSVVVTVYVARNSYKKLSPIHASVPPANVILLIFVFSYLPFLTPGALLFFSFDRYMLPILPILLIFIAFPLQRLTPRVPTIGWACVGIFAAYGVVATHDYFAALRARTDVERKSVSLGLDPKHISVGLERDGWQQLQTSERIRTALYGDDFSNAYNRFWFWQYTSTIQPDFVAISSSLKAVPKTALTTVEFRAWTRPFKRAISVVRRQDIPLEENFE